jgi:hypothetical protein
MVSLVTTTIQNPIAVDSCAQTDMRSLPRPRVTPVTITDHGCADAAGIHQRYPKPGLGEGRSSMDSPSRRQIYALTWDAEAGSQPPVPMRFGRRGSC